MNNMQDYFSNCSIVAQEREKRPMISKKDSSCPFCYNHLEAIEQLALEVKNEFYWIRIVNNKYPFINENSSIKGVHDVVIDTIKHDEMPQNFSFEHWKALLMLMQKRWHQLSEVKGMKMIQIFKNNGLKAGASIYHSHWQMAALKQIPPSMQCQYDQFEEAYQKHGSCVMCTLDQEVLLEETAYWKVIAPSAAQWTYEIWLIPKRHVSHYGQLTEEELAKCGLLLKKCIKAYMQIEEDASYNICMMSGPLSEKGHYHFYIKLIMRKGNIAGFELATNCYILTKSPKAYGAILKEKLESIETRGE